MKVNKKPEKSNTNDFITVTQADVEKVRVHEFAERSQVFFTLIINGVRINDCRVVEGEKGDFIGMPSRKGNDGKYYNYVYAKLSPEDTKAILNEVEKEVNS